MICRFGDFELDDDRRELRLRGREVVVEPLVFDLLQDLVRNRDRVVTKDELLERVWPGTLVTDGSLQRAVSLARSALRAGDAADAIRTFPRRGYRFSWDVQEATDPIATTAADDATAPARRAFERNDWTGALAAFREADRSGGLAGPDLERAAWCLLNLGRPAEAVPFLERAAAAHGTAGDRHGSARAALLLSQVHLEGRRLTVAQGWQRRAARMLTGAGESREGAGLEWMFGRLALAEGDLDAALRYGERALALAQSLEDVDLEAVALILLGHVCVARGEVRRGLALQDEAAATVLGSDVAPWFAGLVYCGLVYICQNRGDWSRAAQWTDDFARWSDRCRTTTYPAVCRLHVAEVRTVRGELIRAECELTDAREDLERSAPWAVGDAERLLGDVLRMRGDLAGAERAYRRAEANGWDPCPGWAELLLERGETAGAVRALERAIEDPSWPCRQRRRLLTAGLARAVALDGDARRARELLAAAEQVEDGDLTLAQRGAMERARAEVAVAEGDPELAIRTLRACVRLWHDLSCPVEMAPLRQRLADLLHDEGEAEAADLELAAAEAIWREAGAESRAESCATRRTRASTPRPRDAAGH